MTERCKLSYNDDKYYNEDLIAIGVKEAEFNRGKYQKYQLDRVNKLMRVFIVTEQGLNVIKISFDNLHFYRENGTIKPRENKELVVNGVTYTDSDIRVIGRKVASQWAGDFISYRVDKKSKKITFYCVEHGEEFTTFLPFEDLKLYDGILRKCYYV